MGIVPRQSCKIWLLGERCREFLNGGQQFHIEVNHFYKNGKRRVSISLLLQKILSLQEFQYILHVPEKTEITILMVIEHRYTDLSITILGTRKCLEHLGFMHPTAICYEFNKFESKITQMESN